MWLIFIKCPGKREETTTTIYTDPDTAFLLFHHLCRDAFGAQCDFKVDWGPEGEKPRDD